jgi:hypothetical protein
MLVVVLEKRELAERTAEAGDVVIDKLRNRGVLADDDKAGRYADFLFCPELEGLLVVSIQRLECRLERRRKIQRVEPSALPRPFFGILSRMCSHRLRNIGISRPGMLSAIGTRGSLTMPHSIASMSEKSLMVQGKSVPSA